MNRRAFERVARLVLLAAATSAAVPACAKSKPAAPVATPPAPAVPTAVPAAATTKTPPATDSLPPPARAIPPAELAQDFTCGPFRTQDLEKSDRPLLSDRLRVRFLPGGKLTGSDESAKIEVQKKDVTMFVGARELLQRGDEQFARRAAKLALFDGGYEAVSLRGRDQKLEIVTGMLFTPKPDRELVAVAHGWFLDANRDVLDVAVFVSGSTLAANLAPCRLFAQKLLSTVEAGPRLLTWEVGTEVEKTVSYAKFHYKLPPDWKMSSAMGIHDFARIHFRKRGVFPAGGVSLQLALDSHPGDWATPGKEESQRKGQLLGLPVTWRLTNDHAATATLGAWTISTAVTHRDHAVGSLQTSSAEEREEAIRFAESIRVGP